MRRLLLIGLFLGVLLSGLGESCGKAWAGPNDDLLSAAFNGDIALVKASLRAGADVNAKTNTGITALMEAVWMGKANMIRLLLKGGADVNAKADNGTTALMQAAGMGKANKIRLLLKGGADVNARDANDGTTALMQAVMNRETNVIRLLLKGGADVNAKANTGLTARDYATGENKDEVISLLDNWTASHSTGN